MPGNLVYTSDNLIYSDQENNTLSLDAGVGLRLSNGIVELTINREGFTNGIQSLLFQDIYTTVEKTQSIKYVSSTPNKLSVVDTIELVDDNITPTVTTTITPSVVNVSETSGKTASYNSGGLTVYDGVSDTSTLTANKIELTTTSSSQSVTINNNITGSEPFIELVNSVGKSNKYNFSGLVSSESYCYSFDNENRFFKQNNPFSFRHHEIFDGDYIYQYMPFVMIQNGNGIKLFKVSTYLDDNGFAGGSCIVSNYGGGTLQIDINDASSWYSHDAGGNQSNPIVLKKWVTCRITLVYSSIDSQYVWAVSQF